MRQSRILPFYMSYPMPLFYQEEDTVTRDLEYLQEMYPLLAKKYQKVIAGILDRLDYEGSMIYDEYPDKWQIYRLTQLIVDQLKKENAEAAGKDEMEEGGSVAPEENWERVAEFVQVLLCYEIYKKRHTNQNGVLRF